MNNGIDNSKNKQTTANRNLIFNSISYLIQMVSQKLSKSIITL